MSRHTPEFLNEQALLYAKLLTTTRDLIQIMVDNDESPGDLPAFYERIQQRAEKCLDQLNEALGE